MAAARGDPFGQEVLRDAPDDATRYVARFVCVSPPLSSFTF